MQTPKASRKVSLEVPQRASPSTPASQKSSPSTNRTARQLKVAGSGSDSVASPNSSSKTLKNRSPKVLERGSLRSPIPEKRQSKLSELESQLAQLQDELKKAKGHVSTSEALKQSAQQEAEETKKELLATSARLEESQQKLLELSSSEDARIQELRKLSQERDQAWQSEIEAIQNQHSMDSSALASAMNEIQKLKRQLEMVTKYEATQNAEIQSLMAELSETRLLVENTKEQLNDCKRSEAQALEVSRESQMQLEEARETSDLLQSEGLKATEAYNSLALELEVSKAQVSSLESLVRKFQKDLETMTKTLSDDDGKEDEANKLKAEIDSLKLEVSQLETVLEASELRYHEEYIKNTLQIRNAFDQVEQEKSESSAREAEFEAELKKAKSMIEDLKSEVMCKESMLHNFKNEENEWSSKKSELEIELNKLKEVLLDKETQIQNTTEENNMLKEEREKREVDRSKENEEAVALVEAAKAAEREALMKLGYVTEEADKSNRKAARVGEQLDAAQGANSELEAELRRLKVQSDQWRKAAEAAAAVLCKGDNGKFVDRSVSLDSRYNTTIGAKMESPLSDDVDYDSPKKKNGNMFKKIGVLWKKGQK